MSTASDTQLAGKMQSMKLEDEDPSWWRLSSDFVEAYHVPFNDHVVSLRRTSDTGLQGAVVHVPRELAKGTELSPSFRFEAELKREGNQVVLPSDCNVFAFNDRFCPDELIVIIVGGETGGRTNHMKALRIDLEKQSATVATIVPRNHNAFSKRYAATCSPALQGGSIIFGGFGDGFLSDLWLLRFEEGTRDAFVLDDLLPRLTDNRSPDARDRALGMTYHGVIAQLDSQVHDWFLVFRGWQNDSKSDLWALDIDNVHDMEEPLTWKQMDVSAAVNKGYDQPQLVFNNMILFGSGTIALEDEKAGALQGGSFTLTDTNDKVQTISSNLFTHKTGASNGRLCVMGSIVIEQAMQHWYPVEWSTENHMQWPRAFRDNVRHLLLLNARDEDAGNELPLNMLPVEVIMNIVRQLSTIWFLHSNEQ